MQPLRAKVRNGRIVLDEPTDLPEGKEVNIVLLDDDGLDDESRRRLLDAIDQSLGEATTGKLIEAIESSNKFKSKNGVAASVRFRLHRLAEEKIVGSKIVD